MPIPLEILAAAIHEHYRAQAKREGWSKVHDVPFASLPPDIQHANLAAAQRIPAVLATAGLRTVGYGEPGSGDALTESEALAILESQIEPAAIAEHDGWMAEKIGSGWHYAPRRDDAAKHHPSIIPYADLSEVEKEKDRSAIRNYPAVVHRAGMLIVRAESPGTR